MNNFATMNTVFFDLGTNIRLYYENKFCITIHSFKRSYFLSIVLIYFYFYWCVCFLVSKEAVQMMQRVDQNIPDIKLISFLDSKITSLNVVYAGLSINFAVVFFIIIDAVVSSKKLGFIASYVLRKMQLFVSLIMQVYNSVIFIPLVYHSMKCFSTNYSSIITFSTSIFISILICLHDQSYSFIFDDYLSNRSPFTWQLSMRFLEIVACLFLAYVTEEIGLYIINGLLGTYRFIYLAFGNYINSQKTLFWMLFFCTLHLAISVILFFGSFQEYTYSISLLFLLALPLSFSIAQRLTYKETSFDILINQSNYYLPKHDYLIRQLLEKSKLDYEDYRRNSMSIFLERISVDHILNCNSYPKCFCNEMESYKYQQFQEVVISGRLRQKFLNSFLYELFQRFCTSKKNFKHEGNRIDVHLSFISYLTDIKKSKVQVFCELVKFNAKSNLSSRERSLIYEIYDKSQNYFNDVTQLKNSKQNKKTEGQPYNQMNNQIRGGSTKSYVSVEQKDFLCGIKFDEQLNDLEKIYMNTLNQKENLIKMMCNDYIDLLELRNKSIKYYETRQQIEKLLQKLSNIHYNSQKLQFYMDRYIAIMAFGKKKKALFKNTKAQEEKNNKFEILQEYQEHGFKVPLKKYSRIDRTIFDKDNCVIFITLIDQIGTIKRSQSKIESMFGYQLKEIIGNNITVLIPHFISQHHDKILEDFVSEQIQSEENFGQNAHSYSNVKPFLLAKNSEGWAVPVSLSFKTDNIGLEECGLSAHLTKLKTESAFFLTSTKYFQVQLMSELLFERLLVKYCSNQSEIRKIYLNRIIPLLHYFEKHWVRENNSDSEMHKDVVKTVAFLPKQDGTSKSLRTNTYSSIATAALAITGKKKRPFFLEPLEYLTLEKDIHNYSVDTMDIYSIKIKFQYKKNKYFAYNIVEILSLRKINEISEIKENIIAFSNQMKSLLSVNYPHQREIQKLEESNMFQDSQNGDKYDENKGLLNRNNSENTFKNMHSFYKEHAKTSQQMLESVKSVSESQFEKDQSEQIYSQSQKKEKEYQESSQISEQQINISNKRNIENEIKSQENHLQFLSSRQDIHDNNEVSNNQLNSNNNLFDDFSQINQVKQEQKKYIQNLQNGSNNNNNNFNEQNILYPESSTSRQLIQNLQILHKQQNEGSNNEEYNLQQSGYAFYTPRDTTNYQTEPLMSNQLSSLATDRYNGVSANNGSDNDQGKIEKLLFENSFSNLVKESNNQQQKIEGFIKEQDLTINSFIPIKQQLIKQHNQIDNQNVKLINNNNIIKNNNNEIENNPQNNLSNPLNSKQENNQNKQYAKKIRINQKMGDDLSPSTFSKGLNNQVSGSKTNPLTGTIKTFSSKLFEQHQNTDSLYETKFLKNNQLAFDEKAQNACNMIFENQNYQDFDGEDLIKKHQFHNNGSVSVSDDYYDENAEAKKKSQMMATSSIQTSKSHNYEQKRNLKYQISSKKKNFLMIILTLFGSCSVSVVLSLTVFQYFNIINQFGIAEDCIGFLPWPMSFRGYYVTTMAQDAITTMIEEKVFDYIEDNNFKERSIQLLRNSIHNITTLLDQYEQADDDRLSFFNYLHEEEMTLITSIDDGLSKNPEIYQADEKMFRNVTVAYFIQFISGQFYQLLVDINDTLQTQKIQVDNFLNFNTKLVHLQGLIEDQSVSVINQIQSQVLILLILVVVLSILLICAIFPLYYFVQVKNEQLLKLFATIQPDHLKAMLLPIQIAQNENKPNRLKIFPDQTKKKKSISTTSILPKFKPVFLFYALVSFTILIIQPITNYVLSNQFRSETFTNMDLLLNLYDLKANFISSAAVYYSYMAKNINPESLIYNINYYEVRIPQIVVQNQQQLEGMYATISQSYSKSRYQQDLYDNFLYKIIEGDMCAAFKQYPEFIKQQNQITDSECTAIKKGSLRKGFQFSVKEFFSSLVDLYQISQDKANFLTNIIQWEKENNIQQFDSFYIDLYKTIDIMKDFMLKMMSDQLSYMTQIQTILLLFQLFALLFVFSIGWMKFYFYVQNEMYIVKNLISIISIEVVLENPYILSYLNK